MRSPFFFLSWVCKFFYLYFLTVIFATTTALQADVVLATRKLQAAPTTMRPESNSNSPSNYMVITKPGCVDKCGNLSLPYPFGMGSSNCYRDHRFKITCNYSKSRPVAYLKTLHRQYEVLHIMPTYVRINILTKVICDTDNVTGVTSNLIDPFTNSSEPDLEGTIFTISHKQNKLMVLGCNIYGYITTKIFEIDDLKTTPSSGCASRCSVDSITSPYPCIGSGCCKVSIPKGLTKFNIQTNRISFGSESEFSIGNNDSYGPCSRVTRSRVFLVDQTFSGFGDLIQSKNDSFVPLVLDWAISEVTKDDASHSRSRAPTCREAKKYPSSYACGQSADCHVSECGAGYYCKCLTGYEGNPYLLLGCQDIDECKVPHKCGEEGICINAPGSYSCECPPGWTLDISKQGYLCTPGKQRPENQKDKQRLPIAIIVSS
ncbi:hypothetical protein MKW98_020284, partial [Papaver atlanticum]